MSSQKERSDRDSALERPERHTLFLIWHREASSGRPLREHDFVCTTATGSTDNKPVCTATFTWFAWSGAETSIDQGARRPKTNAAAANISEVTSGTTGTTANAQKHNHHVGVVSSTSSEQRECNIVQHHNDFVQTPRRRDGDPRMFLRFFFHVSIHHMFHVIFHFVFCFFFIVFFEQNQNEKDFKALHLFQRPTNVQHRSRRGNQRPTSNGHAGKKSGDVGMFVPSDLGACRRLMF